MEIDGQALFIKSTDLDPQELRFSLLFWDKLVWPTSRNFVIGNSHDAQFLVEAGVMERPDYTFDGDVAEGMARGFRQAFTDYERTSPGQWAMSYGEKSLILRDAPEVRMNDGITVELHRAIPVPERDVPLAEILEFKHKRYEELTRLRTVIDFMLERIQASDNDPTEIARCIDDIDDACRSLLRVGSEWQFPVRLSSMKTTFELRPFQTIAGALTGALATQALPTSNTLLATLTGAVLATAPALKIAADIGWQGLRKPTSPFRYVSSFHKELF